MLKGGQNVERRFLLDEYPVYIKAGSIIPQYGDVKNLRNNDEAVTVTVYLGNVDTKFDMYEDNGNDKQYATAYATTLLSSTHSADGSLCVKIGARKGEYSGMPSRRQFRLKLVASAVPEKVTVDGKQTDFEYDGNKLSLLVNIPETDCSKEKVVEISYAKDAPVLTDGLIGSDEIPQPCHRVRRASRNNGVSRHSHDLQSREAEADSGDVPHELRFACRHPQAERHRRGRRKEVYGHLVLNHPQHHTECVSPCYRLLFLTTIETMETTYFCDNVFV